MTQSSGSGMYGGTEPNPFSTAGWFNLVVFGLTCASWRWRARCWFTVRGSLRLPLPIASRNVTAVPLTTLLVTAL
jgi:hypothetical protein